jgi:hypothetical protein
MTMLHNWFLPLLVLGAVRRGCSYHPVHPRYCDGTVRHVHLAVGPDPSTEMTVSFASVLSNLPAPVGGVFIGTSPSELTRVVVEKEVGSSYNIAHTRVRHEKKDKHHQHHLGSTPPSHSYFAPYYHHVTISDLQPSTTYYYRPQIRSNITGFQELEDENTRHLLSTTPYDGSKKECPPANKLRSFTTAPVPGPENPLSLAVMGDLGQFENSIATMTRLLKSVAEVDAVILAGDLAYTFNDHDRWDTFLDFLDDYPVAEKVPLHICPGNHDIDKFDNDTGIFLAYEHRFRMPRIKPAELGVYEENFEGGTAHVPYPLDYEYGNAYYTYTYGPARMIMLNAYSAMEPDSLQYKWLVEELASVDRSITPWLLVTIHIPFYNTFDIHRKDPQVRPAIENLEPLFVEHKVNLVFSGHIHAYQRTGNVAFGELTPTGPIYITIGAGGRQCKAPFLSFEPEPWVKVRDATFFGYGMFHISNRTHAEWEWIHTGVIKVDPTAPQEDKVDIPNQFFL